MKAEAVAAAFGLGSPVRVVAHTHASAPTWRLETANGRFLVKRVAPGWRAELTEAMAFERRAAHAGVDLPRAIEPQRPAFGYAGDFDGELVRVYEWHDSTDKSADPRWLGATLARLHQIQPLDERPEPRWYGIASPARWHERLELGQARDRIWVRALRDRLPDIIAATDWIATAFRDAGDYVFTHRDVEPWNVVHTAAGPLLADWDTAGPDSATLEAAHAILDFAQHGRDDPDPAYITQAREAYGRPLDADPILARRLGLMLERMSHRIDRPADANTERRIRDRLDALPAYAARLRRQAALFRPA